MYKINGMYYLISTDYKPNGRTLCSRSKSIWGPYETITITADETFGYHAAPLTQVPEGVKYRIGEDGTKFGIPEVDKDATACTNIHRAADDGFPFHRQNGDASTHHMERGVAYAGTRRQLRPRASHLD